MPAVGRSRRRLGFLINLMLGGAVTADQVDAVR
jgi:hypothetical protein